MHIREQEEKCFSYKNKFRMLSHMRDDARDIYAGKYE